MRRFAALIISVLFLGLFATGCCRCGSDQNTATRYHEDGRAKPIAAMPVMIDTSSFEAAWSISEELTDLIVRSIARSGKIYIQSQDEFAIAENPFSSNLSWTKREFENQEFVVFAELVEHEFVPAKNKDATSQENSHYLNMAVRFRVLDLRNQTPKIALQEIVRNSYYIPKTLLPIDYNAISWGSDEYASSPMGIAHTQIAQEIATRISDYILLAKSK